MTASFMSLPFTRTAISTLQRQWIARSDAAADAKTVLYCVRREVLSELHRFLNRTALCKASRDRSRKDATGPVSITDSDARGTKMCEIMPAKQHVRCVVT